MYWEEEQYPTLDNCLVTHFLPGITNADSDVCVENGLYADDWSAFGKSYHRA